LHQLRQLTLLILEAKGVAIWGVVYVPIPACEDTVNIDVRELVWSICTNLVINELFGGIVFLQHTEKLDDTGILVQNEQQISDLQRGRTSASNLRLVVRYS